MNMVDSQPIVSPTVPTVADVQRISALDNAVLRNLQITQCYHDLAHALTRWLPQGANWCTVATWASRQAGQSIRQQDLQRTLERLLQQSSEVNQAIGALETQSAAVQEDPEQPAETLAGGVTALKEALDPAAAFGRVSQAVARGNQKVFAEIGLEFARFLALFEAGLPADDAVAAFCITLRPGDPPQGQRYLQQAFTHYHQALSATDEKERAELMLLSNLEIGFHEQTRLQPEIRAAMDAPVYDPAVLRRRLLLELFPDTGSRIRLAILWLVGRASSLIAARDRLAAEAQRLGRHVVTEHMMTLELPRGKVLRLGHDLQGRSAQLGSPSVFQIESHSQPSVILGAPPMHVDYILPEAATGSEWQIVNFTAVPDDYNSSYSMTQTKNNQSSNTNKTSYTYSTKTEGGGSFSLKPPYLPSISASLKKTTEDKNESVTENYSFTQNEFTYNASTTTGFGDEIWYDASTFYLYIYQVLGHTVCPQDTPNCSSAEAQPLYLMFSGPKSAGTGPAPGNTTEWYQPVHEPGNIFSYPWNEAMLAQQIEGGIHLLTGPQNFFTDTSTQSQNLNWSSASGTSQTAGTTNNHSTDKSYSMTAGKVIGKVVDVSLQGNLDYSESTSTSSLNKSSSSLGSSQGITIDKPGSFLNSALYQYRVEPYIFGRNKPAGTVDSVALNEDIQTNGPLQAAFAVNPLDPNAGSWWGSDESPYKQYIDVALNHPARWTESSTGSGSLSCLGSAPNPTCMVFNDPNPDELWNSEFYWMRGLYITVGGVEGSLRTHAKAGDQVNLQARVYNYSFLDMPAGSTIQVRFYRQPMSGTTPDGNSVLISQVEAARLPGFNSNSSPTEANWRLVTTSLDTTGLDDTLQIFWVLVWAEDSAGNMLTELPGHGLSAKPGSLNTIGNVPLEEVTLDGAQKTFSNNVGYLHSRFYIDPAGTQEPSANEPALSISNVEITPATPEPGGRVIISADIFSAGEPADGVRVNFFPSAAQWHRHQDDPTQPQPRPFDVEQLPHIAADGSDHVEVPYRANVCGIQEILITAEVGVSGEVANASATFDNGPCLLYYPVMPAN